MICSTKLSILSISRVSRDNLAQNTLNKLKNSKGRSTKNSVEITKKLFAHACKEEHLFYHNTRLGTKAMCDTSNWADIARNMTQKTRPLAKIVVSSENNEIETNSPSITPPDSDSPEVKPHKLTTVDNNTQKIDNDTQHKPQRQHIPAKQIYNQTTKFQDAKPASTIAAKKEIEIHTNPIVRHQLSHKEYLRAKYLMPGYLMLTESIDKNPIGKQIPEEALEIYGVAKSQQHHHPAFNTFAKKS